MKPFLILQLRPEDEVSDNEFESFLKFGGLSENDVRRIRMEKEGLSEINLDDYSGVLVGGGPFNVSDADDIKTDVQQDFDEKLMKLLDQICERDFPYLGACYGIGILSKSLGGVVSKKKYGEDAGGVTIKLTEEGEKDPLLSGLSSKFRAFGGHKEACQHVPEGAVLLASSDACPVQMIRVKKNVYAAQFHTELDTGGIEFRVWAYKDLGYFPPEDAGKLIEECKKDKVEVPMEILKRFVDKYAQK